MSRSTRALRASTYPMTTPLPAPTMNPRATSWSVVARCGQMVPSEIAVTNRPNTTSGAGRMNGG